MRTWWLAVERLLRRPKDDVLWVFFDPRQNIYGGSAWEALGLHTAPLAFNCRNTQRIARYAYGLVGAEPKLRPGTPDGVEVVDRAVQRRARDAGCRPPRTAPDHRRRPALA